MTSALKQASPIRIGSRGSALALAQTEIVRSALSESGIDSDVIIITTEGDVRPPNSAWGEGAFVGAIEAALLSEEIDLGVHSAKDLPTDETPGVDIVAYLPRAAACDVLVLPAGLPTVRSLDDIASGSRIGTDSPRRTAFVQAARPDLEFHALSGNVDTRLRRLDDGQSDALILAEAGLARLHREDRISLRLPVEIVPPAPGQGALAVQARSDDTATRAAVASLDHQPTRLAVELEREFLATTGGGCRAPIGAFARVGDDHLDVTIGFARPDGGGAEVLQRVIPASLANRHRGPRRQALVAELLAALIERGASAAVRGGAATVLVTRPARQAAPLALALLDLGFAPAIVPTIEIEDAQLPALAEAVGRLETFDWVVVTSANAADALTRAMDAAGKSAGAEGPSFAAIGAATARALRQGGVAVAFRPPRANAASLAETLPLTEGRRVLLPRSDIADARLIGQLGSRGADVHAVVAYRTIEGPATSLEPLAQALARSPELAVLTSGSAARGLIGLARQLHAEGGIREVPVVCAGPETADEAERVGLHIAAVADRPDARTIAKAVASVSPRQSHAAAAARAAGGS